MRRIIASAHVSLDGVMQSPGGAGEDPSGGFDLGGWTWPFADERAKDAMLSVVGSPARPHDLLLGRRTYDIFAGYWPQAPADSPFTAGFNKAAKYVLTHSEQALGWANSHRLRGVNDLKALAAGEGPDIVIWGSSTLYPQLLEADLIDRLNLLIYPIILGRGKRLFGGASHPVTLRLMGSEGIPSGIVVATYERK